MKKTRADPHVYPHTYAGHFQSGRYPRVAAASHFTDSGTEFAHEMLVKIILSIFSLGLFSLYWIGHSIYCVLTVDSKMQEKALSVDDLIMKLRQSNNREIEFTFEQEHFFLSDSGQDMVLKNAGGSFTYRFKNRNLKDLRGRIPAPEDITELPSTNVVELLPNKPASVTPANPRTANVTSQFQDLYNRLNKEAKGVFKYLFKPLKVGLLNRGTPFVVGDGDGSTGRMLAAAIATKNITITNKGLTLLAKLLNQEAKTITKLNAPLSVNTQPDDFYLQQFQLQNKHRLAELVGELTFQKSDTPLIFIGDNAFDRFSTDLDIDRAIRERLHACGVKFITGILSAG